MNIDFLWGWLTSSVIAWTIIYRDAKRIFELREALLIALRNWDRVDVENAELRATLGVER